MSLRDVRVMAVSAVTVAVLALLFLSYSGPALTLAMNVWAMCF